MQIINRIINLKQILRSLLIAELFLLILSPFKILILVIPFVPILIYAINLKINDKVVTLKRLLKYIVIATIILVVSILLLILSEPQMFVRWRRVIGLISAMFFIAVIIKCSFFIDSPEVDNNYINMFLLKQINILYILFFGLISILIYNDFLGLQSSSSSILINSRWLAAGVVLVSIAVKIIFISKMKDYSLSDVTSNPPSQKKLEEYKSLLQNHFEVNKLFLKHELNKEIISRETNIPLIHIDYLFNNYLEVDMNHYIAEYRIGYALNLMREKGDVYTLNAISSESGFRSRATFIKYFKYFTNVLPSEYLNKSKRFIS